MVMYFLLKKEPILFAPPAVGPPEDD